MIKKRVKNTIKQFFSAYFSSASSLPLAPLDTFDHSLRPFVVWLSLYNLERITQLKFQNLMKHREYSNSTIQGRVELENVEEVFRILKNPKLRIIRNSIDCQWMLYTIQRNVLQPFLCTVGGNENFIHGIYLFWFNW